MKSAGTSDLGQFPPVLNSPAGLQSLTVLRRRRVVVLALNLATYTALLVLAAQVLGAGGWSIVDVIGFCCFALGSPWAVLGFWNAVIGLFLLHGHRAPLAAVAPYLTAASQSGPINIRTAILMTLRNEEPERALLRLRTVKASVDATGHGKNFSYFVLSDSDDEDIFSREAALVDQWCVSEGEDARIIYRRRAQNTGFKAGNLRDFCARWGDEYELMLPLDADSVMSGEAIVGMVRTMEAHPKLGILQSLVVGMPSRSAFARIFQFGMRFGMRSYTMGQAWWTADCGPFWGHNGLVRIKPFAKACELPILPGTGPLSGHVMSHDQVEAALMRRAGYEVRVVPVEDGSWEENPPTIIDFAVRDERWCQGNLQYLKLLDLPGLEPMSRFQLVWAILMFVGIPAWTVMIALAPIAAWEARTVADFPAGLAAFLYVGFLIMYLSPKIAGVIDAALTKGGAQSFGGWFRFLSSVVIELVFSFLQGAVSTMRTTLFIGGLILGSGSHWSGQSREASGLPWSVAWRHLWPQTLFGVVVCVALALISPEVFYWSLPLTAGYILAVPFAVITALPAAGSALQRSGLCGVPEDFQMPPEVAAVLSPSALGEISTAQLRSVRAEGL